MSKNIRVYVSTDEQSLFGSEPAPEGYDTNALIEKVYDGIKAWNPEADVQVYSGHSSRIELDEPNGVIEDVVQGIVHQSWQEWLREIEEDYKEAQKQAIRATYY